MQNALKMPAVVRRVGRLTLLVLISAGILAACQQALTPSAQAPGQGDASKNLPLRLIADIPLPGNASRFDYQSLDATQNRLYIAHMRANSITVFDVKSQTVITDIQNVADVHGILAIPQIGKTYATATGSH